MSLTTTLSGLDIAVIAAYFAVTLFAGLFMGRFVKSGKDFFSGGNKVPWWMGAISSYMAMISSFVFIAHGGVAYQDGLVAIVVFWSCAFAVLAGTWIFAGRWRRANVSTPMEYLERRYGAGVRQFISWCGIGFRILDNMVRLYTLGLIASVLLNISIEKGIWIGVGIVLAYTLTGGLWSVLVTDVIQCTILLGVSIAVLPVALGAAGGIGALSEALPSHFDPFNGHRGEFWFLFAYYAMVFIKYNANWAFIPEGSFILNILNLIKTFAPLVVVGLVGIEFMADKHWVFRIIFYIMLGLIVLMMFFPSTWNNFVGVVQEHIDIHKD